MTWALSLVQTLELPGTEPAPCFVFDGIRIAALVALGLGLLVSLLGSASGGGVRREPGRLAARVIGGLLAALAAACAVAAPTLEWAAASLLVATLADLALSVRGRRAIPAWIVGLASPAGLFVAGWLRKSAGGDSLVEWLGTPFGGDLSTTLAFLALAVPLALPGALGGVWAGLSCGPDADRGARFAYGLTALVRPITHAALVSLAFAGSEPLVQVGSVVVWVMPIVALLQRCAAHQLSSLAYAAFWALIAGQGAATERSADAFALGLVGLALPLTALALALALVRGEESAHPGLAPKGIAQLFPLTFWASLVSAAAVAGAPFLGPFHGRVQSAGALEMDGKGLESAGLTLAAAPLFALVALPWIRRVFIQIPSDTGTAPVLRRRREPRLFLVGVLFAAAGSLLLGFLPELLGPLLPYGDVVPVAAPTPLGQLMLFTGAALAASFSKGQVHRARPTLSSTP